MTPVYMMGLTRAQQRKGESKALPFLLNGLVIPV